VTEAHVCEQLVQSCYLAVQRPRVDYGSLDDTQATKVLVQLYSNLNYCYFYLHLCLQYWLYIGLLEHLKIRYSKELL